MAGAAPIRSTAETASTTCSAARGRTTSSAGAGDDYLHGGDDNDRLTGGAGDDFLDGDDGSSDTAVFAGAIQDYDFAINADGLLTVSDADLTDGDEGTDTLRNIDQVEFSGVAYSIDSLIDADGGAVGSASVDFMVGGAGADVIDGGAGADTVLGGAGGDTLTGGLGADTLIGGAGDDDIDGGDDADVVVFSGDRADYTITESGGVYTVADNRSGAPDGTDTVSNVEVFRFADGDVGVDDVVAYAPTDLDYGAPSVAETATTGASVGAATVTDANPSDTHSFELLDDAGGAFAIDADTGEITVADPSLIDYETAASMNVTVRVTDSAGETYDETVAIAVTDDGNVGAHIDLNSNGFDAPGEGSTETITFSGIAAGNGGQTEVDDGVGNGEYALWSNVGSFQGVAFDIKATIVDSTATSESFGTSNGKARLEISNGEVEVRYEFFEAGTENALIINGAFLIDDLDGGGMGESLTLKPGRNRRLRR